MRGRMESVPLFWRVFGAYSAVLLLAFAVLVFAPITVSVPIALAELAVLVVGLVVMLVLTYVLIRPAFAPLMTVTETMREIDPLSPGQRVPVIGGPQVAALAE